MRELSWLANFWKELAFVPTFPKGLCSLHNSITQENDL